MHAPFEFENIRTLSLAAVMFIFVVFHWRFLFQVGQPGEMYDGGLFFCLCLLGLLIFVFLRVESRVYLFLKV